MTTELIALLELLRSRYALAFATYGNWGELKVPGGIAMSPSTFLSLVGAAKNQYKDTSATFYEMESVGASIAPVDIDLDFESFRQLKGKVISHFEMAMVPMSRSWVALLTTELDTVVYGTEEFLSEIARGCS